MVISKLSSHEILDFLRMTVISKFQNLQLLDQYLFLSVINRFLLIYSNGPPRCPPLLCPLSLLAPLSRVSGAHLTLSDVLSGTIS